MIHREGSRTFPNSSHHTAWVEDYLAQTYWVKTDGAAEFGLEGVPGDTEQMYATELQTIHSLYKYVLQLFHLTPSSSS